MSSHNPSSEGLTMAILGCGKHTHIFPIFPSFHLESHPNLCPGTLGTSLLKGLVAALKDLDNPQSPTTSPKPALIPTTFLVSIRTESAQRHLHSLFSSVPSVSAHKSQDVSVVAQSSIILLTCPPLALPSILSQPGLREALSHKLLISCIPGVSISQIEQLLYPRLTYADQLSGLKQVESNCAIVRAVPNIAGEVGKSSTVVSYHPDVPPSEEQLELVDWIFGLVGEVTHLPAGEMDAATALSASGPAFWAVVMEAAVDGAVAMGLGREEATRLAAEGMRGTAELVLKGERPGDVKDRAGTAGGATMGGLMVLEEGKVRGTVGRAVREAATLAGLVGRGLLGVNGTRGGSAVM
ncbi:pyrroline carboxylate reductase [Coniochaeta sp. 2T2.1]|nr:pyrroline carboxylate reductase [Coniochaeta sp. 2T2.1]